MKFVFRKRNKYHGKLKLIRNLNFCPQVGPFSSQHEMLTKCGATLRTPDHFAALTEQAKGEESPFETQQDNCKCDFRLYFCNLIIENLILKI